MAVDAVLKTIDQKTADNVDLKNIRIIKKVGGTIEDSEMIDGLVLNQPVVKSGGGPARMEKARIGLIQFQLSPPKPDVSDPYHGRAGKLTFCRWRTKLSLTTTGKWTRFSRKSEHIYSILSRRSRKPNAMSCLFRSPY